MNKNRREILTRTAAAHREALRQRLQRRMEAARARGDETLLRQLENEAQYLG
jgi:hypothetical protein